MRTKKKMSLAKKSQWRKGTMDSARDALIARNKIAVHKHGPDGRFVSAA